MARKSTEKQAVPPPVPQKFIPFTETQEGLINRMDDLEYWRDIDFKNYIEKSTEQKVHVDEDQLDDLKKKIYEIAKKARDIEESLKEGYKLPKFQTYVFRLRVLCACGSKEVIIEEYLGRSKFKCMCNACQKEFEFTKEVEE